VGVQVPPPKRKSAAQSLYSRKSWQGPDSCVDHLSTKVGERHHIPVWVCKQIENAVSLLLRHVSSQCNSGRAPLHYHRPGAWWVGRRCLYRAVEQRLEAACHAHDHLGEAEMDGPSSR
jgi:hypothetical protein